MALADQFSRPLQTPKTVSNHSSQVKTFSHDILQAPPSTSFSLLIVINAVGIPGRLIPALISDRLIGPLSTFIPVVAGASILFYSWIAVDSITTLFIFAGIYGFFGGGIQSLFPTASSSLTHDLQKRGVRMGMMFSIVSFATLTGPPLAGALIQKNNGDYLYAQIFGGSALCAGMFMLMVARFVCTGKEWKQKL
jgi:MFS family permease